MSDQVEGEAIDAAAIGLALAFPSGLRGQLAAIASTWAPVDKAVAAGSAGLVELGLVTAGLNGSAAVARPIGAGRIRKNAGDGAAFDEAHSVRNGEAGKVAGLAELVGSPLVGVGASDLGRGDVSRADLRRMDDEAGLVPVAPIVERDDADAEGLSERVYEREDGPKVVALEEIPGSAAPVGAAVGSGRTGNAGVAVASGGLSSREAIAPAVAFGIVTAGREDVVSPVFETSSGSSETGITARGIAPVAGALTGLRADVGAALKERAAMRGPVESELGSAGSVASSRDETLGSTGARKAARFDEPPAGAGSEGAWAPQPAERGTGGLGGDGMGVVHLDGRLVGHWLSEGMARDAARPGAGTTSFDARQAPAWTPSGAL